MYVSEYAIIQSRIFCNQELASVYFHVVLLLI